MTLLFWLSLVVIRYCISQPDINATDSDPYGIYFPPWGGDPLEPLEADVIQQITVYYSNFEFSPGGGSGYPLIANSTDDWSRGYNYMNYFDLKWTRSLLSGGENLNGDTIDLDTCLTALPEKGPGDFGYYIRVTFEEMYEVYRLRVVFAYDWPNGQDISEVPINPNIAVWFYAWDENLGGQRVRYTGTGWLTRDFANNGVPKDDTVIWNWEVQEQSDAPITKNISVYVSADGGDYVGDDGIHDDNNGYAVCEILVWGEFVSASPTMDPTMDPVAPSQSPTLAPSQSPTSTPSLAPSAAPTPDVCPNFDVKQPCCASTGGYHYVNNSYDRRTNELIADDDIESKCYLSFDDQQCCGNGTYTLLLGASTIACIVGGSTQPGRDKVCNPLYLTDNVNKTWYGYDVYNGTTTTYTPDGENGECACRYEIYVCEVRTELECIGSDVPYPNDDVLCAISSNDVSPFVGGGETDILTYSNVTLDDNTQTCECNYMADNCLDDIDKRDYFDIIGDEDDNDTCTVNFIQDCCDGSEMSFGGVAISSLDLTSYANLSQQGAIWECSNGYQLCDIDGLPTMVDVKETFFSWVYNEYDSGNIGFEANTLCECLVVYNNCTTTAPTPDTKAPTTVPTLQPSTTPTMAPTKYQFDDYDDITVGQPCCGDASITNFNPGNRCPADNSSICLVSRFKGKSNRIRKNMDNPFNITNNGDCSCRFDVGYWNWNIPSKRLPLPVTTWTEILDNITWNNASRVPLFDADRRRLLQTDTNCFNFYVTECNETSQCMEESAPITPNATNLIQVIGSTFENWTDFTADGLNEIEEEQCFCYYMYYTCDTAPTTTIPDVISTSELPITMNDTDAATTTTTKDPVGAPETSEGASTAEDPFYEEYITLAEENPIIAGAAGAGLFLFCCMTCVLCCKRCKQRKAEKDREQLEKYKSEDQEEKQKDAPPATTQTKPKSADEGGGLDIAETAPIVPKGTSRGGPTETQPTQPTQTKPPAKERVPDTESQSGYTIEMQQAARPPAAVVGAAFESTPQPEVKQAEENYETEYDEDVYSVQFTEKPFGITFGGSKKDKDNLLVQGIDGGSAGAKLNVIVGSTVVRFEDEEVEGLGPKKIFKIFKGKYADMLPLRITFRKPQNLEEGDGVEDEANGGYEAPTPAAPVPAAPAEPVIDENEQNEQAQEYENGADEEYAEENAEQNEEQYDENYNENYDENQENYDENAEYDEEYEYYED